MSVGKSQHAKLVSWQRGHSRAGKAPLVIATRSPQRRPHRRAPYEQALFAWE